MIKKLTESNPDCWFYVLQEGIGKPRVVDGGFEEWSTKSFAELIALKRDQGLSLIEHLQQSMSQLQQLSERR